MKPCIFKMCRFDVQTATFLSGHVDEYQLPFYDCVQPDPSHEEMKKVVCDENRRPAFAEQWHTEEVGGIIRITSPLKISHQED